MKNHQHEVAAAAQRYPDAWRAAHRHGPDSDDFIRLLAADLHAVDPNVGLNGKRGNPNDISDDALAVFDPNGDVVDRTGRRMFIVDVIVGAGGPDPRPGWQSVGGPSPGAWVQPAPVDSEPPGPSPEPPAPPVPDPLANFPDRHEVEDEIVNHLEPFYEAAEGLQRPKPGLSLHGRPDVTAIAAWVYDVYLRRRLKGANREAAREAYKAEIRKSREWKDRHPSG